MDEFSLLVEPFEDVQNNEHVIGDTNRSMFNF
jgi:hypothetical protein